MNMKNKKYYLKIITFLEKLCFFDRKFIDYMEDRVKFVRKLNDNLNNCIVNFKNEKMHDINLILPYPNSHDNFILCIEGFCEAYVYYLIKRKVNVDNNYLETLKESVKRIYIEENFRIDTIRSRDKKILKSLKRLNDEQIIGLALSFEISNGYMNTGCFIIPDEYFFDSDKALEYAEIELNYRLGN